MIITKKKSRDRQPSSSHAAEKYFNKMQIFQLTMFILSLHLPSFFFLVALSSLNKNLFDVAMAKKMHIKIRIVYVYRTSRGSRAVREKRFSERVKKCKTTSRNCCSRIKRITSCLFYCNFVGFL